MPPASSEPQEQEQAVTTRFEGAVWARSQQVAQNGDIETVLKDGETTLAQSWYLADEGAVDYVILTDGATVTSKGIVERAYGALTPSLEGANQLLYESWHAYADRRNASDADGGLFDIDDPGCDIVDARGWLIDGANHCMQNCCTQHDACFFERGCTAASFNPLNWSDPLACKLVCNVDVARCLGLCAYARATTEKLQRATGANPCPEGQHQCYDADCGDEFYCRTDCYTEPSPCEAQQTADDGERWCSSTCRDMAGRKGYGQPQTLACGHTSVTDNCDCGVGDEVNAFHLRCKDESCEAGKLGFCALFEVSGCEGGSVPGSPCCGGPNQPCCADYDNGDVAGDGSCNNDNDGTTRCWREDSSQPSFCLACGGHDQPPCLYTIDKKYDARGCDSGIMTAFGICRNPCEEGDHCCDGWASDGCDGKAVCSEHTAVSVNGVLAAWADDTVGMCLACGGINQRCCVGPGSGPNVPLYCDGTLECDVTDMSRARGVCREQGFDGTADLELTSVSPWYGCGQVDFTVRNNGDRASDGYTVAFGTLAESSFKSFASLAPGASRTGNISFGSGVRPPVCGCLDACFYGGQCSAGAACDMRLTVTSGTGLSATVMDVVSLAYQPYCQYGNACL